MGKKKKAIHPAFLADLDGMDINLNLEEMTIRDISSEQSQIASKMAWWGAVEAYAASKQFALVAMYRNWRASYSKAILEREPKLAEWKVKAQIEADDQFVDIKKEIGEAERVVLLARRTYGALEKMANQLQSIGAAKRGEMKLTGMNTKMPELEISESPSVVISEVTEEAEDVSKYSQEEIMDGMREILSKE